MRRTTICRSKAPVALALILLGAQSARAQQPEPQPAAQQPAMAPASLPATHLVQGGETLWSLAQQYFGDPLLWPEIYRLNTDVIEDPHWIFPGEELRIAAPPAQLVEQPTQATPTVVAVAPDADTSRPEPAPQAMRPDAPTIFTTIGRRQGVTGENLEVTTARAQPVVSEGEYYSAPWLTEGEAISTGRLLGNVQASNVRRVTTSTSAQQFNSVAVEVPGEAPQPGELLVAMRRSGTVRGYGEIIRPTGLLRVASVGDRTVATVVTLYGQVQDGQEVVRLAPWQPDTTQPEAVENGINGSVVGMMKAGEVVQSHDAVFIDKGSEEGVRPGDVFQLLGTDTRAEMGGQLLPQAEARIINVRPHTATAIIVRLVRPDVRVGSTARQIRRVPG